MLRIFSYCCHCHRASANIAYKRLKDVASRCVLRDINASKCVCGQGPGELTVLPRPVAGFGGKEGNGGEGKGRESKAGTEGREREGECQIPNKTSGCGLEKA